MIPKIILFGYWILCFTITHLPPSNVPSVQIPHFDKLIHMLIFLGLATLFSRAYPKIAKRVGVVIGILMLYALVDEVTQPGFGREADILDGVADFVGAGVGMMIYRKFKG